MNVVSWRISPPRFRGRVLITGACEGKEVVNVGVDHRCK